MPFYRAESHVFVQLQRPAYVFRVHGQGSLGHALFLEYFEASGDERTVGTRQQRDIGHLIVGVPNPRDRSVGPQQCHEAAA